MTAIIGFAAWLAGLVIIVASIYGICLLAGKAFKKGMRK